jgi:hypothetical protein
MKQTVNYEGQDLELTTITVGALETVVLDGKKGRAFKIALIAASLFSSGDTQHGNEDWVRALPVFDPEEDEPPFMKFLAAANKVNGFKPKPQIVGESEPAAPAA